MIYHRIIYICPDDPIPAGGIKQIYRQVDILNAAGYNAFVLHSGYPFRCTWFKNNTRLAYPQISFWKKMNWQSHVLKNKIKSYIFNNEGNYPITTFSLGQTLISEQGDPLPPIQKTDMLVFPEYNAGPLHAEFKDIPFVIFNQNAYYSLREQPHPYLSPELKGVMVVSDDSADYLHLAFPHLSVARIHNSINPERFNFHESKKMQVAYMPRKCSQESFQVRKILEARGQLKNWSFAPIEGCSEEEVAQILKESALFLSFSISEGCPLPPAEAMACGCLIVGYTGQGGKEYIAPPYAYPIEQGNIIAFVQKVEEIAKQFESKKNVSAEASKWVLSRYSIERERSDIVNFWENRLKK